MAGKGQCCSALLGRCRRERPSTGERVARAGQFVCGWCKIPSQWENVSPQQSVVTTCARKKIPEAKKMLVHCHDGHLEVGEGRRAAHGVSVMPAKLGWCTPR